ncbi:right-handed parallel beta-helix repeat-containing protein [Roseobacter litoralis]|uniref:right-handed parallel beta-helix repeat-containing protein n=1 Tax=Roseobacter litoralis TaxID=42443 RepID=UPI00249399A2|nr:right-handed parallel beta-helix repeat-containing protein [Roseobacter litoralis]
MNILSLGVSQSTTAPQIKISVASSFDKEATQMKLRLARLRTHGRVDLTLSALTLDDRDTRPLLRDAPASPELAELVTSLSAPSGDDSVVAAELTQTLELGALYLVSYEISEASPLATVYFPRSGCPFDFQALNTTPGVHNRLVTATSDTDTTLLRTEGSLTFGFVSCCKAEWTVDLPLGTTGDELSNTTTGRFSGAGRAVATTTRALTTGEDYVLYYEITGDGGSNGLFTAINGPFGFRQLPRTIGVHNVILTCQNAELNPFLRINGDLTFGAISLRLRGPDAGRRVNWEVGAGELSRAGKAYVPSAEIYVSPTGSDSVGTGAATNPYQSPEFATSRAMPGDTIFLRPGVYDPFEVQGSGNAGSPLTITTLPGEERQVIIRGDLKSHVSYGGPGVAQNNAMRDGIRIVGKNHVVLRGLTVEYCWRNGIFIAGHGENTVTGNHIVEDCFTQHTGLSGILACGERPELPVSPTDPFRTRHITIRNNEVTQTNVVTDYNDTITNSFGEPGGVGEAITVANSVQHVYVYGNNVHNSRQYGIDFKNHVVDGEIHGNRIDRVIRYGIYLDAGETDIRRISVKDNVVTHCRAGIVLSREEDDDDSGDGLVFEDIDIDNNTLAHLSRIGIHFQRHPSKDQQDIGHIRRIRARLNTLYNTNTDGFYRDLNIDDWATFGTNLAGQQIVDGIELRGNIAWNPDGDMWMRANVADDARFTVVDNFNVADGQTTGIDPLFKDPLKGDFSLQTGSPADPVIRKVRLLLASA